MRALKQSTETTDRDWWQRYCDQLGAPILLLDRTVHNDGAVEYVSTYGVVESAATSWEQHNKIARLEPKARESA